MRGIAALAVASVAVGLASGQTRACQNGFVEVGGECLAFLASYGTWDNQLQSCTMVGGSLAKVTGDLHNAVYQHIIDSELTDKCFWIGGSDRLVEGQWKWENDQTDIPLGGPHWDPCEPEPEGGSSENYLAICPSMYYYKDYPGSSLHYAICQIF
uniref:C-type lectin n=1 Tax=Eriocheir sinensis TaxID=95602 RepID=K4F9N2_ERISI|nr:C-type lectin [Eriocheir sinensis]